MEKSAGFKKPGKAVIAALGLALGMKLFLFDFMITEGSSMEPAVFPGTVLLINKLAYGFRPAGSPAYLVCWALPAEGDVVVFIGPEGRPVVKRCREVRDGTFMALGDNAPDSYDSRAYGSVPIDRILGKVVGKK